MDSRRCLRTALSLLAAALLAVFGGEFQRGESAAIQAPKVVCPVTLPNILNPDPSRGVNFSNGELGVGVWPGGEVLMTPSFDSKPGGPFGMKFPSWRAVTGELKITGRRLDGTAPPPMATIPGGYGETGFQATGIDFPTAGCWEVTGRVGDATLTFVTLVVEIREPSFGPALAPPAATPSSATPAANCPATIPNGEMPPGVEPWKGWHHQGDLWLSLMPNGVFNMLGSSVLPNGTYEWTMDWWRGASGTLTVSGRRVDGPAPALGVVVPDMQTDSGYQPAVLFFPTTGCWQVTGTLGKAPVTATILVTRGP